MGFFAFLSLLSCVVSLIFGGFIFLKSADNLPNKIFFHLCISSSLLGFAEFELRMAESFERAVFWTKVYAVWPIVLAFLIHYVLVLNKKTKILSYATLLIYVPAITVMFIELFTHWVTLTPIEVSWGWTFVYDENMVSVSVFLWAVSVFVLSVYHSLAYFLKSKGQIKKQAYYIFIGYLLNAIVTVLFDLILPAYQFSLPELGNSFSFILLIILGYAIWKYQLFEIKPETLAGKIVATISDALFFVDSKLGIIEINQSALRLLEYDKDELLGQPFDVTFDQSEPELRGERIYHLIKENGIINDLEVNFRSKNNKLIPVSLSATPVSFKNGEAQGVIFLGRNITERKRMVESLKRSESQLKILNADKDKFFSILAHDLKNPFHSILSSSNLLAENYTELDEEERKDLVSYIHQSSRSIFDLLENLLTWSRAQQGNIVYRPAVLNLKQVVSENITSLKDMAAQKSISLITRINDDLLVQADRDMFSIVLRNLVSNAIKFTPDFGQVTIAACLKSNCNGRVEISVEDTGIGISHEEMKNLFIIEKSYTTTGTNEEKGTGLGLLLCKEFAEKMGSRIGIESEIGKGSRFYFNLERITEN